MKTVKAKNYKELIKTIKATSSSYHEFRYYNLKQSNFVLHFISACFNSNII